MSRRREAPALALLRQACFPPPLARTPPRRLASYAFTYAGYRGWWPHLAHEAGLDLVDDLEQLERHEDHHSLAAADVHLLGRHNVQLTQLGLQVVAVCLEIADRLGDIDLEGLRLGALLLDDLLLGKHLTTQRTKRRVSKAVNGALSPRASTEGP